MNFSQKNTSGVSPVLGFAILIALSITVSIVIVASASGGPITAIQDQSNEQQAIESFSVMSSNSLSSVIDGDKSQTSTDLPYTSSDNPLQVSEDSYVTITVYESENKENEDILLDEEQMGYIKYDYPNSSESLYLENGAVWRTGENYGSAINEPEFHFIGRTLTFPIVQLEKQSNTLSQSAQFTHVENETNIEQSVVEASIVEIKIESPTYQAWGDYFEKSTGSEDIRYNHTEEIIEVDLGITEQYLDVKSALHLNGDLTLSGGQINGDVIAGDIKGDEENIDGETTQNEEEFDDFEMDDIIDAKISEAQSEGEKISDFGGEETVTEGLYYVSSIDSNSHTEIDLSEGDVTLAVDGDISLYGGGGGSGGGGPPGGGSSGGGSVISVTNPEGGDLETYMAGDFELSSGIPSWTVESDDFNSNVLFGTSDSSFSIAQNGTFEGIIYAPSGDDKGSGTNTSACREQESLCMSVNSTLSGAIVTDSAHLSQDATINYDEESLENFELEAEELSRPRITYIHTSTARLEVDEGS